jgi:hypothetical protein
MTITLLKIEEFKIGLALLNLVSAVAHSMDRAALIDSGDDICGSLVETHETFADFCKSLGQPAHSRTTPAGYEIHEWTDVQFRRGQTRGSLYLMEFAVGNVSMYNGGR